LGNINFLNKKKIKNKKNIIIIIIYYLLFIKYMKWNREIENDDVIGYQRYFKGFFY